MLNTKRHFYLTRSHPRIRPEYWWIIISKLYFSALKSLEMVSLGSDNSIALYADEEMYPEFPFADSSALIDTIRSEIQEIPVNTLR